MKALSLVILCLACVLSQSCVFQGDYAPALPGESEDDPQDDATLCVQAGVACGEAELTDSLGVTRTVECPNTCGEDTCFNNACVCRSESDEDLCAALDAECGVLNNIPDRCGLMRELNCGQCAFPERCEVEPNRSFCSCLPRTTCDASAECGSIDDGCGGILDCMRPACDGDTPNCGPDNRCQAAACEPVSCAQRQAECDTIPDGCGAQLDCGTCGEGELCDADNTCACVPKTCEQLGAECGELPDGCGGTVRCDRCPAGNFYVCNDATNACVCLPETVRSLCHSKGSLCGSHDLVDRCGRMRPDVDCSAACRAQGGRCTNGRCNRLDNPAPGRVPLGGG